MKPSPEQVAKLKTLGYNWIEEEGEFWHEDFDDKLAILPYTFNEEWQQRGQAWTEDEWEWDYETFQNFDKMMEWLT